MRARRFRCPLREAAGLLPPLPHNPLTAPPPCPRAPLPTRAAADVGPVNNPSETYGYFTLPFCGKDGSSVDQDLGESLTGDRKVETPYEINFRKDVEFKEVCVKVRVFFRGPGAGAGCSRARQGRTSLDAPPMLTPPRTAPPLCPPPPPTHTIPAGVHARGV